MNALIVRKRQPRQRLRRRTTSLRAFVHPPLERADAGEDEACELIGPGSDRGGDSA
jgi:hypothetical protein